MIKQDQNFNYFFLQNPAPLLLAKPESLKIISVNTAFLNLFEFEEHKVLSKKFFELHPEKEQQIIARKKINKHTIYHDENQKWHLSKADGSIVPVQIKTNTIELSKSSFLIITIQVIQKTKFIDSQENIDEILLNNVPDLIFRLDHRGTYLNVRTKVEQNLYVPKEEFLGKTINEI